MEKISPRRRMLHPTLSGAIVMTAIWKQRALLAMGVVAGIVLRADPVDAATLRADYRFQNSLASSVGTAATLTNAGAGTNQFATETVDTVQRTVLRFPRNNGLLLNSARNVIPDNDYSLVVLFRFDEVGGYRRIADFKNNTADSGLYNLNSNLNFYPVTTGTGQPIQANRYVQVVLTRDAAKNTVGYVDGRRMIGFTDTSDLAVISTDNLLRFFIDDVAVAGEASAGAVARIRLYDGALTATEVAALDRLPTSAPSPTPTITRITPMEGPVGSRVTITGTNLRSARVFFNGVAAIIDPALSTATRLVVTVPTGASSGLIRVVTANGSVNSSTAFRVVLTVSGSITSGMAPIPGVSGPVPNAQVYLINRSNLAALGAIRVNPALLAAAPFVKRAITNAQGIYTFSNIAAGNYRVVPAIQGVFFTQSYRDITVRTTSISGINFVGAGVDNTAPSTPTISSVTATSASGSASDKQAAGILSVIVTLQNSAGAFLDWTATGNTASFTGARPGSYKSAGATVTGAPIMNQLRVTTQAWAVALPANLPVGSYRLTVRSIDRAFRISVPVTRVITKAATANSTAASVALSNATANAGTSSITLRFSDGLQAESASDPAYYNVSVNGLAVPVQSAGYNAATHTVTLALPEGSVQVGDVVVVRWSDMIDADGATMTGQTTVTTR